MSLKLNQKINALLEEGFTLNTISKLPAKEIDFLYSKLISEVSIEDTEIIRNNLKAAEMSVQNMKDEIGEEEIDEKSVSKSQQRLMGQALAVKRGEIKKKDASKKAKDLAKSMSEKELEDFAKTKHKGLPTKVKKKKRKKSVSEENDNPCWDGYEQYGTKMKDGKEVPNCVPIKENSNEVRKIEESIVNLLRNRNSKKITKMDFEKIIEQEMAEPAIAPPKTKPKTRPKRKTPYKPKHNPKPKAKDDKKEGLPEFLKFKNLNIQFRDEKN